MSSKQIPSAGVLALIIVLSLGGQVFAQSSTTSGPDLNHMRKANEAREQFLPQLLEMNAAEAELGRMAAGRAQSPQVREFARMLTRVHSDTLENLGGLHHIGSAGKQQTSDTMREKPGADAVRRDERRNDAVARLSRVSAADFDREFMNIVVEKHRAAAAFLQSHLDSINAKKSDADYTPAHPDADATAARVDEGFAMLCRQLLPVVNSHLRHALDIQRKLQTTN